MSNFSGHVDIHSFGDVGAVKFPEILLQFSNQLKKYAGGGAGKVAGLGSSPWQYIDIFCLRMCNFVNLYLNSLLRLLLHI